MSSTHEPMAKPSRAQPRPSLTAGFKPLIKKRTPPPVLASEALREDLAPLEPGRSTTRVYHAVSALTLLVVGLASRAGLGFTAEPPNAGAVCMAAAAATGAAAIAPVGYRWRAGFGAAIGLGIMVMGGLGRGPLALLAMADGLGDGAIGRMLTAILLPATLLFRSHYRAYQRGRLLLLLAYLASLPFVVSEALDVVQGGQLVQQFGASVTLVFVLSGLFAFWGTPPVSVMAWIAPSLTVVMALDVVLVGLQTPALAAAAGMGALAFELTALTLIACASIASLGLFQILAAMYARDARRINVHPPEPKLPTMRPSSGDYQ